MTLAEVKQGQKVIIQHISDPLVRAQAIRFGIAEGSHVLCATVIPSGPITLKKNLQEIAIGRGLAARITVRPATEAVS
jgi:Fe2+ transport system protein FeoA